MITQPFHPLAEQSLEVLGQERRGGKLWFRCVSGPLGTIVVPAEWTDRFENSAGARLTYEVLVELCAAAAAVRVADEGR